MSLYSLLIAWGLVDRFTGIKNIMKTTVAIIAFTLILGSLGFALFFLMKDKGKSNRTVNALAFRVAFSIALFLLLLIAYHFDLIQPTGIRY
jgi:hypothetical protein